MVYVGKHASFHTRSQDEIHELLLAFAGEQTSGPATVAACIPLFHAE
jgi:hypothetical protein